MSRISRIEEIQDEASRIFNERNTIYKDNYKKGNGELMKIFFPDGVILKGKKDFNRWSAFIPLACNLVRYASAWGKGGSRDAMLDIINYASMLIEIDEIGDDNEIS